MITRTPPVSVGDHGVRHPAHRLAVDGPASSAVQVIEEVLGKQGWAPVHETDTTVVFRSEVTITPPGTPRSFRTRPIQKRAYAVVEHTPVGGGLDFTLSLVAGDFLPVSLTDAAAALERRFASSGTLVKSAPIGSAYSLPAGKLGHPDAFAKWLRRR
ncbi:hypothetical protein [Leifsonia sp. Leaf264]|uniref:hypothetical protein n=1 Tax=Leifsonia sp. Leaf264 TaxID=1736314 RepID=UPI0006FD8F80|nr:hypothetical protein [Leifsonia sp. Leaf264]KQO98715.1 hypothetical protein ASF30_11675 [Leifsonia sp. Leaf264]